MGGEVIKVNLLDKEDEHVIEMFVNPKFTNFHKGQVIRFINEDDGRSFKILDVVHDIQMFEGKKVSFHELSLIVERIV